MTTVAILEGGMDYGADVDLLGFNPFKKIAKGVRKVASKVTRPIRKITRPITRPLNRILKKTPVARTLYRAAISSAYLTTGQLDKLPGAVMRTYRSGKKDFGGAKKFLIKAAMVIVRPMFKSGMSKTIAKVTAIPILSAKATGTFGPWAIPLVGVALNTAINKVWKKVKRVVGRAIPKGISSFASSMFGPKFPTVPSGPFLPNAPQQAPEYYAQEEPKKTGGATMALLAVPALALLMGV